MRAGVTISAAGHVAVLLWSVITFAAKPLEAPPVETLPVDIVSAKDFSAMTAGVKTAKPDEKPKPLAEKVADKKSVDDPTPKPVDKPEIVANKEPTPAPPPPVPPPLPQTDTKLEVKKVDAKLDPIADALKKDETLKPAEKKEEANAVPPPKPKPPIPVPPNFDPMKIKALLDKQEPRRQVASAETPNRTMSLGLATGTAAKLSQSELDALRARLAQLWNPPVGAKDPQELIVTVRVQFTRDGKLAAPPDYIMDQTGKGSLHAAARDSAARAIIRGQPYDMLHPETYDTWKDVEITFDPRDMLAGR
jgi:hypothetical protein